ncbi:MAG TPA: zinc-dependent metalloprotease [Acidimicrobiales bacterium]
MSESDPPDGEPDPFQGIPFLGDLAKILRQQGAVSWDAAGQLAFQVATGGESEPNVDPLERIRLEELARVAELQVAQATGLSLSTTGRAVTVAPVTRTQWVQASLPAFRPRFERLAGSLAAPDPAGPETGDPAAMLGNLMGMMTPMLVGMAAGSMVGHLASTSFGVYDLPIPRPPTDELIVVGRNVDEFAADWSLPDDDLRLWVCLHEMTHHAVLGLPHVRARLDDLLNRYAAGFEADPNALEERFGQLDISDAEGMAGLQSMFNDPEAILGAVQSPAQRALLPQLDALVAVVIGYADHVMDSIGEGLISSYGMLAEALRRRRVTTDESSRFVERLLGLELTQDQCDRGEAFVAGVVERAGNRGLERLWRSERELPTPAEVDAPGLWLARIDLPDAE